MTDVADFELELVGTTVISQFTLRDLRTGKVRRVVNGEPLGVTPEDSGGFENEPWFADYMIATLEKAVTDIDEGAEPNRGARRAGVKAAGVKRVAKRP
jgi:hypothetical protein